MIVSLGLDAAHGGVALLALLALLPGGLAAILLLHRARGAGARPGEPIGAARDVPEPAASESSSHRGPSQPSSRPAPEGPGEVEDCCDSLPAIDLRQMLEQARALRRQRGGCQQQQPAAGAAPSYRQATHSYAFSCCCVLQVSPLLVREVAVVTRDAGSCLLPG
jgi:hypothetical protein